MEKVGGWGVDSENINFKKGKVDFSFMVVNIQSYQNWRKSLSEDKAFELIEKRGAPIMVNELFHFGLNKNYGTDSVYPVSGNLRRWSNHDYFEGMSIGSYGYSYIEGVLDNERKILKMIEFYE